MYVVLRILLTSCGVVMMDEPKLIQVKQLLLPIAWTGQSEFYLSLKRVGRKIYLAYFENLGLSRAELAKKAGCGMSSVNKFLNHPDLPHELGKIIGGRLQSPEMLEVIDAGFHRAKTPAGVQDRKLLMEAGGYVGNGQEAVDPVVHFHSTLRGENGGEK